MPTRSKIGGSLAGLMPWRKTARLVEQQTYCRWLQLVSRLHPRWLRSPCEHAYSLLSPKGGRSRMLSSLSAVYFSQFLFTSPRLLHTSTSKQGPSQRVDFTFCLPRTMRAGRWGSLTAGIFLQLCAGPVFSFGSIGSTVSALDAVHQWQLLHSIRVHHAMLCTSGRR